jgi:hypothetical protein
MTARQTPPRDARRVLAHVASLLVVSCPLILAGGCPGGGGAREPRLALSADQLYFDEVPIGRAATLGIELLNEGDAILHVESVEISGDGLAVETFATDLTGIGPGEGTWIDVVFEPVAEGPVIGMVTVRTNDADEPESYVTVLATGTLCVLELVPADVLELPVVVEGESASATLTLHSFGSAPVTLLDAAMSDVHGGFEIEFEAGASIPPEGVSEIRVSHQPSPDAEAHGVLHVFTDDPAQPVSQIMVVGPRAETPPRCVVLEAPEGPVVEGHELVLRSSAVDAITPSQELWVTWVDLFNGGETEICAPIPDAEGLASCAWPAGPPGAHDLTLVVRDAYGLACEQTVALEVLADDPPEVSITAPTDGESHGWAECVEFVGAVADGIDGDELAVTWQSDHPEAPQPLATGVSTPGGETSLTLCDLPCGEQVIRLRATDSAAQEGEDAVTVTVTLLDPVLEPLMDRTVLLGQEVDFVVAARPSCGLVPTVVLDGLPPGAVATPSGFGYRPLFDPGDNPVDRSFVVTVEVEISLDGDTRQEYEELVVRVESDEFVAVSGEQAGQLRLLHSDYDGGLGAPEVLATGIALEPVGIADLNGDGAADLLAVDALEGAWALLRADDGSFAEHAIAPLVDGPAALGDVDGDGLVDLVVVDPLGAVTTWLNRTDPVWPDAVVMQAVPDATQLAPLDGSDQLAVAVSCMDHDGDGLDDLLVAWSDDVGSSLHVALAGPADAGAFSAPLDVAIGPPTGGVATGYLGLDSTPDLVIGGASGGDPGQAWSMEGDGLPGFGVAEPCWDVDPLHEQPGEGSHGGGSGFASLDLDHDGCLDVIVVHESALDEAGDPAWSTLSIAWQERNLADDACLGSFGDPEAPPEALWVASGALRWAVPHVP